jgi:hypothetical protein
MDFDYGAVTEGDVLIAIVALQDALFTTADRTLTNVLV